MRLKNQSAVTQSIPEESWKVILSVPLLGICMYEWSLPLNSQINTRIYQCFAKCQLSNDSEIHKQFSMVCVYDTFCFLCAIEKDTNKSITIVELCCWWTTSRATMCVCACGREWEEKRTISRQVKNTKVLDFKSIAHSSFSLCSDWQLIFYSSALKSYKMHHICPKNLFKIGSECFCWRFFRITYILPFYVFFFLPSFLSSDVPYEFGWEVAKPHSCMLPMSNPAGAYQCAHEWMN